MKSEKKILIAFYLNLIFSAFEFLGGIITGSVAIISDAIHDLGDASSIGLAYFLERKSLKKPDDNFTYGYSRYSVIGGTLTACILILGSLIVIFNAISKIINPSQINYNGMIVFALIGFFVNLIAVYFTHGKGSINQMMINLHMLEDVLSWLVVLLGALIMRFTDFAILDPIMSIGIAVFILLTALKSFKKALNLFLEKTPEGINIPQLKAQLKSIDGVLDVHHIHVWSMDGYKNYATMHIVCENEHSSIKNKVRQKNRELGISHITIETELPNEDCLEKSCNIETHTGCIHNHHHH